MQKTGQIHRWGGLVIIMGALLISGILGCKRDKAATFKPYQSLFTLLPPDSTGVTFRNDVLDTKKVNPLIYLYAYNGGGVAAGDLNNDGLCDLVFTSNEKGPTVYLNKGNMKFEDITAKSGMKGYGGWFTGVTMVDINADGWLDVYISRSGPDSSTWENLLFINNHNGTFTEQAANYNLQNHQPCTQAIFFDYDNDGDLDAYLVNHPATFDNIMNPMYYNDTSLFYQGKDRLMENTGHGFVDVSDKAGINPQISYGLSASVTDINNDGYPDLYVANDFFSPDHFYINNGNKTFTEKTSEYFKQTSLFSMGSDFGDINNDGYQDLMVVDMMPDNHERMKTHFFPMPLEWYNVLHNSFPPAQYVKNSLQLSNDGKEFSEIAQMTGTAKTDWSWNIDIDDLNNDGLNDIFITRGTKRDYFDLDFMQLQDETEKRMGYHHYPDTLIQKMPVSRLMNYVFMNHGGLHFSDETASAGLTQKIISNGAVTADLDNDGDLDLVINNTDNTAFIYRNNSEQDNTKNYLEIKLEGNDQNKFGIGTVVDIYTKAGKQHKQLANSRGFESCPEQIIHFGLDTCKTVDILTVKWYDGTTQTLYHVPANQLLVLKKKDASYNPTGPVNAAQTLLTETSVPGLNYQHKEDNFIDFKKDRLIPFMLSREGPAVAVGDVNKDGLQDVFLGGAYNGSKGQLLIQQPDGSFAPFNNQPWQQLNFETIGAVFADFNGDGYDDLYLANGSNEYAANDPLLKDKLYLNNAGKGFTDASDMLPPMAGAKTAPIAFDFDSDGDLDLFVAGRMMPGAYPSQSRSYLLRNDGTHFTDVTATLAPGLLKTGDVTSATAADLNHDGKPDLIVTAEWQPVLIFKNTGKAFDRVYTGSALDSLNGWWNCVTAADLNNDEKLDLVVGNQGLNSYLQATPDKPITLYYDDFDGNGVKEPLVVHYLKGEADFLYDRNTICEQMPKFKNTYLTYESYSKAGIGGIITPEKMKTSEKYVANYFKSIWIENLGNFHFKVHELPAEAQLAPTNAFVVSDLNNDGKPDIISVGNSEADFYFTGRSSASPGIVLINQGNGKFVPVDVKKSGFLNPMVCRHMQLIPIQGFGVCLLVANNDNSLRVFKMHP
ncbi:MAG TPA: VCBS repeat-containing protein [Chitinophagales bacterium]|nr:VCBS repeat-containing protein [Chitinophagales bacterium]